MIRGFWQSKAAVAAVVVASWGLTALIWVRRFGNGPVYIPILASVLMLALGIMLGRLVGNIVASNCNVKVMGYLHVDLDPEKFIAAYAGIPGKLKEGSLDQAVAKTYLADGYAARGEFDKAIETLGHPTASGKQAVALEGTIWQKLCSYQLFKGDLKGAQASLEALDALIAENADAKPALLDNLKTSRRILQNRMAAQTNKQVEEGFLLTQVQKATYQLLRLELWQTLAIWAIREGDEEKRDLYLYQLKEHGGKTFFQTWAQEREKTAS